MIKKLRMKVIAINMSIVTIMLCIILGMVFHFMRANLENENVRMMERIAQQPFQLGNPGNMDESIRLPYFMIVLGPAGEIVTTNSGYYDLSNDSFLNNLIKETIDANKPYGVIKEYNLRYYKLETPVTHCLVFSDISSEVNTLRHLIKICVAIGILSFGVFLCLSIWLSKWAVRPVEEAWKQQKQFVADASHELKTPLTVIMTNAELAMSDDFDEKSRSMFMESIVTMSHQMKKLIEQLLKLACADNAEKTLEFTKVDLSKTVSEVILTYETVFFEKGMDFTAQIEEGILVQGVESDLRQVMEILFDNATKYTKEHGKVKVSLMKEGASACRLTVSDEGEPISEENLKNIFKRFYRADEARSRDSDVDRNGSFGLGLAIAQEIVTQHKGRIWAESSEGINSFHVMLYL